MLAADHASCRIGETLVVDRPQLVAEVDELGLVAVRYTGWPGSFGGLAAARRDSGRSYYHFDLSGHTRLVTDAAGNVEDSYVYEAFGQRAAGGAERFGYGGQYGYQTQPLTGHALLTLRTYDPRTGRFLNVDPVGFGGGGNLYGYCGNDPVNEVDPWGLMPWLLVVGGVLAVSALIGGTTGGVRASRQGAPVWPAVWKGAMAASLVPGSEVLLDTLTLGFGKYWFGPVEEFYRKWHQQPEYGPAYAAFTIGSMVAAVPALCRSVFHLASKGLTLLNAVRAAPLATSAAEVSALRCVWKGVAETNEFGAALRAYESSTQNRFMRWLAGRNGLTKVASVPEVIAALEAGDTCFATSAAARAALILHGERGFEAGRYLLQAALTASKATRIHELLHLAAALRGQANLVVHELLVAKASTPGIFWGEATTLAGLGIGLPAGYETTRYVVWRSSVP